MAGLGGTRRCSGCYWHIARPRWRDWEDGTTLEAIELCSQPSRTDGELGPCERWFDRSTGAIPLRNSK